MYRSVSRGEAVPDDVDFDSTPKQEKSSNYEPPEHPNTGVGKFYKKIHRSSWLIRYFVYITPLVLMILLPLLLGLFIFPQASVGGVFLVWFCIWLEIVWLTLWAGRVSGIFSPQFQTTSANVCIGLDSCKMLTLAYGAYCKLIYKQ
jgi:hypothetical protein